jgi:hypothetical protein
MNSKLYSLKLIAALTTIALIAIIGFSILSTDQSLVTKNIALVANESEGNIENYKNALSMYKVYTQGIAKENLFLKYLLIGAFFVLLAVLVKSIRHDHERI